VVCNPWRKESRRLCWSDSVPGAKEFDSISHLVGRNGCNNSSEPAKLATDRITLLLGKNEAGVRASACRPSVMQSAEVGLVEGIQDQSRLICEIELLFVHPLQAICVGNRDHMDSTGTQGRHQI
jgi:hypothetical protein